MEGLQRDRREENEANSRMASDVAEVQSLYYCRHITLQPAEFIESSTKGTANMALLTFYCYRHQRRRSIARNALCEEILLADDSIVFNAD